MKLGGRETRNVKKVSHQVHVGRMAILVLFLILEEMPSVFHHCMMFAGWSYMAFIMLRYVASLLAFWRVLIINGC